MMSRLRNWWGSPPPPRPIRAPEQATAVPAPAPKPEPTGIELFMLADNDRKRDKVLREHPFWQQPHIELQLGGHEVAEVIRHICSVMQEYSYHARHFHDEDDEDTYHMRGVQWGSSEEYSHWHQRAVALAQAHPEYRGVLLRAMVMHLDTSSEQSDEKEWLREAEDFLQLGGRVSTSILFNGLLSRTEYKSYKDIENQLVEVPLIASEVLAIERDADIIEWVKDSFGRATFVAHIHPRLTAWRLCDAIEDQGLVKVLAEEAKDGALLKAWHGIALTGEETLQHPLAYSLYVHKHAPIYLEEAQPLPAVWSMALSLSSTGSEFQEMLLNAAHLKMDPEKQPGTLALPDLEV